MRRVAEHGEAGRQGRAGFFEIRGLVGGEGSGVVAHGVERLDDAGQGLGLGLGFRAVGQDFEGTGEKQHVVRDRGSGAFGLDEGGPPGQPADELAASGGAGRDVAVGVAGEEKDGCRLRGRGGGNGQGQRQDRREDGGQSA